MKIFSFVNKNYYPLFRLVCQLWNRLLINYNKYKFIYFIRNNDVSIYNLLIGSYPNKYNGSGIYYSFEHIKFLIKNRFKPEDIIISKYLINIDIVYNISIQYGVFEWISFITKYHYPNANNIVLDSQENYENYDKILDIIIDNYPKNCDSYIELLYKSLRTNQSQKYIQKLIQSTLPHNIIISDPLKFDLIWIYAKQHKILLSFDQITYDLIFSIPYYLINDYSKTANYIINYVRLSNNHLMRNNLKNKGIKF